MTHSFRSALTAIESELPHAISSDHSQNFQLLVAQLLHNFSTASVIPHTSEEEISLIAHLSVYHDIGKQMIPTAILNKPGKLSLEERRILQLHPILSVQMLRSNPKLRENPHYNILYDICLHHHERWDGKGYPDGLSGSQITPYVHVIGLADVYDALRTPRPYKLPFSHQEAMSLICSGACGAFAPEILDCFQWYMKDALPLVYKEVSKVG